ncbi:MAG TPA: adenylate/guanylate cyclase domain-containing protein [Roseomonas sp.]|jgi:adenylate cyclase
MPRLRLSFTVTLLTAFALIFTLGMAAVVLVFRSTGGEVAVSTAERSLAQAAQLVAARSRALLRPVLTTTDVLPDFRPLAETSVPGQRDVAALLRILSVEPAVQGISVGFPDGTLRQVLRFAALAPAVAAPAEPPAGTRFILRESAAPADGDGRREHWIFLGDDQRVIAERDLAGPGGDPRDAPWYRQARAPGQVQVSPLYDLPLLGRPGLSVSNALPGGGVLALDITLEGLSAFLATQRVSPNATLFLFDADGILLAHQDPALAVQRLGDGAAARTTWLALPNATDPLLRSFWTAYASAQLRPGTDARLVLDGRPILLRIEPVADIAGPPLLAVVAAPLDDFTAPVLDGVRRGTALALGALVAGLAGITLLAWRVGRPLGRLTREAEAIRRLELDNPLHLDSRITEVQRLGGAMSAMKAALANFAAYVPRDLVQQLVANGEAARLGGDRRQLSVMFTDVEGFTTLAEAMEPEEVMHITSIYFEALTTRLLADHATIDKYIGDAVMALWNAPRRDPRHAAQACLAALRARQVSLAMEADFTARGWPALRTRFGVHSGEAVVGNIGSSDRLSYTAIGTMVNLASRLEGLNKFYGTGILISDATRRAAGDAFICRPVDLVLPKGARVPMEIFELIGLAEPEPEDAGIAVPAVIRAGLEAWGEAIADYRAGRFAEALARIEDLQDGGADALRAAYIARLQALLADPPPQDWSPVIGFNSK